MPLRHLAVAVVLLCCPLQTAFAHDDHGDAEELIEMYEVLTRVFTAYLQSDPGQVQMANTSPNIIVQIGGQQFPVNKSAMHELLTIATMEYNVRHLHERPALLKRILSFIGKFLLAIPQKVYNVLRMPRLTVKNLALSVEAYAHRLSQGYSPGIFVIIGVTQGAWEALESAVMPGGVHMFCTVFNGMLLVAVVPLERIGEFSSFAGSGFSFRQRIGLTLKAMWNQVRSAIGPRRNQFHQLNDTAIRVNHNTLNHNDPTALEDLLTEWGFFDGVYLDRVQPHDRQLTPAGNLQLDLDFVMNPDNDPLERFYVAFAQTRGLSMVLHVLEGIVSEARHDRWIDRQTWLPLERTAGRLRKILSLYSTSMMMMAVGESGPEQVASLRQVHQRLTKTLTAILQVHEEFSRQAKTLHQAVERVEHLHDASDAEHAAASAALTAARAEFHEAVLRLDAFTKSERQNLKVMRAGDSYRSHLAKYATEKLGPIIKRTRSALAPYLLPLWQPVCAAIFGGQS